MEFDEKALDPELTQEELELVSKLTIDEIQAIDNQLYKNTSDAWRKIARVVGTTMIESSQHTKGIPDIFYSQRVHKLIESGKLKHQGHLNCMRYCEVRRVAK